MSHQPEIQHLKPAENGEPRYAIAELSPADLRIMRDALELYSWEMAGVIPDLEPVNTLHRIAAYGAGTISRKP